MLTIFMEPERLKVSGHITADGDIDMTLFKKIAVAAVTSAVFAGSLVPAQALPMPVVSSSPVATSDITNVQYRRYYRGGYRDGYYRGYRGYHGYRGYRGYYGGYGGYYHNYDGYWYPLAAFGAGAIIGGAIASQPRYVRPAPVYRTGGLNPRHYEWCAMRYRSYDAYSNSFQPYNGPRRTCYSPYY
jgi:hypothetical protein